MDLNPELFVNVVTDFLKLVPDVAVNAFAVFIIITLLRLTGVIGDGNIARFSNAALSVLFSNAKLPPNDYVAQKMLATMFLSALMWHVGVFLWEKVIKGLYEKGADAVLMLRTSTVVEGEPSVASESPKFSHGQQI